MQTLHISGREGSGLTIGGVMKSVMFVGELPREPTRFVCKKVAGQFVNFGKFGTLEEASARAAELKLRVGDGDHRAWTSMNTADTLDYLIGKKRRERREVDTALTKVQPLRKRKGWTPEQRAAIVARQAHKCALRYPGCSARLLEYRYEFDHKNGDRRDNSLENGQAVCLNCHGVKTASERGAHISKG